MSNKIKNDDDLSFEDFNEKLVIIKPKNQKIRDYYKDFLEDLNALWKLKYGGWIIVKEKVKEIKDKILQFNKGDKKEKLKDKKKSKTESSSKSNKISNSSSKNNSSSESEYTSESSTDDELIEKVLARRFMSSSDLQEIDQEIIEDSENEDVLSLCRRMRFLYRQIKELKEKK